VHVLDVGGVFGQPGRPFSPKPCSGGLRRFSIRSEIFLSSSVWVPDPSRHDEGPHVEAVEMHLSDAEAWASFSFPLTETALNNGIFAKPIPGDPRAAFHKTF
jgi:hypothetical protein